MAILYIQVPWEESLRKNRKRFNPDKPDSILEHGLSDDKMERLYRHTDWDQIIVDHPGFLDISGVEVPYVVMENQDDVTTKGGELLAGSLQTSLSKLFELYGSRMSKS
jgi:hypothetical protein